MTNRPTREELIDAFNVIHSKQHGCEYCPLNDLDDTELECREKFIYAVLTGACDLNGE